MDVSRRKFLHLAAGAAALLAASRFAWAQAYPTKPVRCRFRLAACSIFNVRVCSPGARARSSGRYRSTAVLVQVAT
jgi:hypothetical protein